MLPKEDSPSLPLPAGNILPIASGSEASLAVHRNMWLAAWTGVGLFAVGCLIFCISYARSQQAAKIDAANLRFSRALTGAHEWIAGDDDGDVAMGKSVEISLIQAMSDENVSGKLEGQTMLQLVRQHGQASQMWHDARQMINWGNGREAAILLEKYLALEHAKNKAEAQWILKELMVANSDLEVLDSLITLDEERFLGTEKSGTITDQRVTRPELKKILNETVNRNLPMARKRREAILEEEKRLVAEAAEKARLELLRQQAEEQRLNAERERQLKIKNRLIGLVQNPTELEKLLHTGEFTAGLLEFEMQLLADPQNDNIRFQLALTQFFGSIQRLAQSLHRYGVKKSVDAVPVPASPTPDSINYAQFRRMLDDVIRDLDRVDSTLARIESDDVAVSLRLGLIRFDTDDDGQADRELNAILKQTYPQEFAFLQGNKALPVDFDRGDATWLRIYCQLMSAVLDFALAFDLEPGFDAYAEQVFANPKIGQRAWDDEQVLRIVEPRRLGRFRRRLVLITELNHEMWKHVRAEKDNGLEWLPNSNQQSVLGFTVSDPLVDSWLAAMTEVGAALNGERVIPGVYFARNDNKGFNLKNLLEDPPEAIDPSFPAILNELPDKYFTQGVAFDLNTLFEVYKNYEEWLGVNRSSDF